MSLGEIQPPFGTTKDSITLDDYLAKHNSSPVEELNFLAPRKTITGKFVPDKKENETMNLGTKEQRTEGMKKQAQELIEQAYNRGYKAGYEKGFKNGFNEGASHPNINIIEKWIDKGRNEAWEAAKRILTMGSKKQNEIFGCFMDLNVMENVSASEAIEKLRKYEEQKKQEEDEKENRFNIGDEVICQRTDSIGIVVGYNTIANKDWLCLFMENYPVTQNVTAERFKKTGRHFDVMEVLKKMQEGE